MAESTMPAVLNMNSQQGQQLAKPLNLQRLEASLDIHPFLTYAQDILSRPLSSSEDSDVEVNTELLAPGDKVLNGIVTSKCGRIAAIRLIYLNITALTIKIFYCSFQIDKMTNCKSTIWRKWVLTENGCRTFC